MTQHTLYLVKRPLKVTQDSHSSVVGHTGSGSGTGTEGERTWWLQQYTQEPRA